ncbi:histone acetyltransferase subunit NuA4-domain-containing protein [Xylaria bambusicola]|uniref:histone acetyltransferase subunit NuA4-domain-containing protein n=1 Tax=Xylaria bambusicola TaxID=326684 RepID=UPI002007D438|nr:histone acetyltransferase subunit NuA4-domain-containing protein [Xylaria bambusicola]KAI0523696.1 histone acetyltransferase subunit NuA4-domain-containing protein [Xylaria bambusicola]
MSSENIQPVTNSGHGGNGDQPGVAHYEKQRQYLKELLQNRKLIERQLVAQEQSILQKETEYLESTPFGNIITGFDGYIKGNSNATAQRKRNGLIDQNRIFSRSSISHNPTHVRPDSHPDHADAQSATSTPAAPTPVDKDSGSNHPTPTSTTTDKKGSNGKKKKAKKEADAEDSEVDSRENKKIRTHFGSRK